MEFFIKFKMKKRSSFKQRHWSTLKFVINVFFRSKQCSLNSNQIKIKIIKNRLHVSITLQTIYREASPKVQHVQNQENVVMNSMCNDSIHHVSIHCSCGIINKLSTLVTLPWLEHTNDDNCDNYEEDHDGKAHPFS